MRQFSIVSFVLGVLALPTWVNAQQQFLLGVDSNSNSAHLFNPVDGSLVQTNYLEWGNLGEGSSTAIHALQVNNQIWVSDQVRDVIYRFNLSGSHLGTIGNLGLDNIRGMELVGNTVWVANTGSQNDAPGNAIVFIDADSANITGSAATSVGIWDFVNYQGKVLVSNSTNHELHFFNTDGTFDSVFHSPTPPGLRFPQQLYVRDNGNVLAAGFSNAGGNITGVFEFDSSGNSLGVIAAEGFGPRGVFELGNGQIMWTNGAGFQIGADLSQQVLAGQGRFLTLVNIPEPGAGLLLLIGSLLGLTRRQKR